MHMTSVTNAVEGYFYSLIKFVSFYNSDKTTFEYIQNVNAGNEKSSFINIEFLRKVLCIIKSVVVTNMQQTILGQCRGRFSIMIDTATDVSASQQLSFIIRYTTDELNIFERCFSFSSVVKTTGTALFKHLKNILEKLGLNIKDAIASATDGASNMSGIFNGFSVYMQKCNPYHLYTWCVAHRFNLVMDDAIKDCMYITKLLSSINSFNTIIRKSPKRVTDWRDIVTHLANKYKDINRRAMPQPYNSTRWWSKLKSVSSMCLTVSNAVAFLLNIKKLYNSRKLPRIKLSSNKIQEIEELYVTWIDDRCNIAFARALFLILREMEATHTQLQLAALPISDMIQIMNSCIDYINKIYNDDEIAKLVENGCSFAERVSNRLQSDEVRQLFLDGGDEPEIPNEMITVEQKKIMSRHLKYFVKLIRNNLNDRFVQNFAKFNVFYSELVLFHPSYVLKLDQNSKINLKFLAMYNDIQEPELISEYKLFADEFKATVQEGMMHVDNTIWNSIIDFFLNK